MERLISIWITSVVAENFQMPVLSDNSKQEAPFLLMTEFAISSLETPKAQQLFNNLLERKEFGFGLRRLRKFLKSLHDGSFKELETGKEFRTLRGELAGFFFEYLAYDFLAESVGENQKLMSPRQTDKLYRWLFRHEKDRFDEHGGFGLGIPGITVPDGIIFDVGQTPGDKEFTVNSFIEYKLGIGALAMNIPQAKHYSSPRLISDFFSSSDSPTAQLILDERLSQELGIPQRIRLIAGQHQSVIYVLPRPKDEQEENGIKEIQEKLNGISFIFVPLTSFEFSKVLTAIIDDVAGAVGVKVTHGLRGEVKD